MKKPKPLFTGTFKDAKVFLETNKEIVKMRVWDEVDPEEGTITLMAELTLDERKKKLDIGENK